VVSGNIFLVGPMGSGKSTIGRQLAKALKRPFFDSDKEIEKRTGVTISWIFEMEGEEGFRLREQQVIAELTAKQDIVLATGGGAVLKEENRSVLRSRGSVVYLCSSVEQLYRRTAKDKSRPLLQTDDPKKQIATLLAKRDPLYKSVADVVVRTAKQSIHKTVSNVIKKLESLEQQ
jgi:shikimate kinase